MKPYLFEMTDGSFVEADHLSNIDWAKTVSVTTRRRYTKEELLEVYPHAAEMMGLTKT